MAHLKITGSPLVRSMRGARSISAERARGRLSARSIAVLIGALAVCVLAPAPARAQSPVWTQRVVSGPQARNWHAMSYDSGRAVSVLFGGEFSGGVVSGDTWEWNGAAWTRRATSGPPTVYGHAMAYDAGRAVTVLFGGYTGFAFSGETWEWNGTTWTRRATTGPSARTGHKMAYDAIRGVTVLFGGLTYTGIRSAETWEWNGISWSQRVVSGPAERHWHAMAYDLARAVTVVFGGYTGSAYPIQTWEWNGTAWTQRATTGPTGREAHAMAYDAARALTVLFGGTSGGNQTWEWNGTAWTQRAISGPSARYGHVLAYDASRAVTVLFGGQLSTGSLSAETWELGVPCVAPTISAQPSPQTACGWGPASFSVLATGSTPRTYQWRKGSVPIDAVANPSAATENLSLTNVSTADAGPYDCVVTNACGSVTSDPAALTVCQADYNCDGFMDGMDYDQFNADFESFDPVQQINADYNRDGFVDGMDYDEFNDDFYYGC